MTREQRLSETFVELADTLVTGFDVVDRVHVLAARCVELTDVDAAGIMLADPGGSLRVMGSSSERVRLLAVLELRLADGPGVESFHAGEPVYADLHSTDRWPAVRAAAISSGFGSVVALPMRLRSTAMGALNLFRTARDALPEPDLALCRALADVATIGLLQERAVREARALAEQLQSALNTRIVVEQAKGVLAERLGLDMNAAFVLLREYARRHNQLIGEVARAAVEGRLRSADLGA